MSVKKMQLILEFFKRKDWLNLFIGWLCLFLFLVLPYLLLIASFFTKFERIELVYGMSVLATFLISLAVYFGLEREVSNGKKVSFAGLIFFRLCNSFGLLTKVFIDMTATFLVLAIGLAVIGGVIGLIYFGWKQLV
jgi:hypothetical protein